MENLFLSKSAVLFPTITDGKLLSAFHPEIMLDSISPQDIGRFAAEALAQPEKCNRKEFVIVGDKLTLPEYTSEECSIKDRDAAVRITIKGFLEERN